MAHEDDEERHWYDDDQVYSSGRDSDDSPLLSNRCYERRQYEAYPLARAEEKDRRSTLSVLMKFFLFCSAMILFCVLLYIPVYNKANDQVSKALVQGWNLHTNRDTKLYVLPNNITLIHEPTDICSKDDRSIKNKLFLLIIVCSATDNFDKRIAIRNTWGNLSTYRDLSKNFNEVHDKYKNYNYTYDLYVENNSTNVRSKRDAGISVMLPEIARLLKKSITEEKADEVEKRFDDDNSLIEQFDMNKEFNELNYDYEDTNVMKIPPNGFEDSPDLEKVLNMLRNDKNFPKIEEEVDVDFKVVFLLGLPAFKNDSDVQDRIEEEIDKYGDVIQEGFTDSYNNLTLKSIMMLKWINNNCNESVRYILKTDDDMYINVPNLIANLKNRSKEFDAKAKPDRKEYLLIGDLICGARPVLDSTNKWFSPRYMYNGHVYPRYLSGTGYALSNAAAKALYKAALNTPYFHLEDIYITGMCARRSVPTLRARDDPSFSYSSPRQQAPACAAHARVTTHRVAPHAMQHVHTLLLRKDLVDRCERIRLTQVRKDKLRRKTKPRNTKKQH